MNSEKEQVFSFSEYPFWVHPFRIAFLFSMSYLVLCTVYIWASGKLAAQTALTMHELHHIETIKGIVFVIISSLLIFILLFVLFRRISKQHTQLIAQKNDLLLSQRQAMAGIFASSVAHDINNVLTILDYHWYLLTQQNKDINVEGEIRQKFGEAIKDLQILSQRLMNTGKENIPSELEVFNLAELIKNTIKFLRKYREVNHCRIEYKGEDHLDLEGLPTICRQLLVNLILNAGRATQDAGKILVELNRSENNAVIRVHDNGPGIPEQEREQVFKAFYTTQDKGTGLGLTSIKVYVDVLGGRMDVTDSELGGACFTVEIPL